MPKLAWAFAVTVLVAACQTQVDSGNSEGVTISNLTGGSNADALRMADEHCKKYGKVARMQQADLPRAGAFAAHWVFACVAPS